LVLFQSSTVSSNIKHFKDFLPDAQPSISTLRHTSLKPIDTTKYDRAEPKTEDVDIKDYFPEYYNSYDDQEYNEKNIPASSGVNLPVYDYDEVVNPVATDNTKPFRENTGYLPRNLSNYDYSYDTPPQDPFYPGDSLGKPRVHGQVFIEKPDYARTQPRDRFAHRSQSSGEKFSHFHKDPPIMSTYRSTIGLTEHPYAFTFQPMSHPESIKDDNWFEKAIEKANEEEGELNSGAKSWCSCNTLLVLPYVLIVSFTSRYFL